MRRPGRRDGRELRLGLLFGLQLLLLGSVLAFFGAVQDPLKMPLEVRPPEPKPEPFLKASEVLERVSLLSGPEFTGIELPTGFRRGLQFGQGQLMWFLLGRTFRPGDGLLESAGQALEGQGLAHLTAGLTGGVTSFVYDLGADVETFIGNWRAGPVAELQASPLLPWDKKLDFLVLSSLAPGRLGGLGFILGLNEGIPILAPPGTLSRLLATGLFGLQPNLLPMPVGLRSLGAGVWSLVLPVPEGAGSPERYELDLIVEDRRGRLLLFSGSGLNRPLDALRAARRALGRAPAFYVGSTGYEMGWDDGLLGEELGRLSEEFPELIMVPNGDTSVFGHAALEQVLGERYRPGRLGTRLEL